MWRRAPEKVDDNVFMPKTPSLASLAAGLLWLAAALCTGYWVLQMVGRGPLAPVAAIGSQPIQSDAAGVARMLGAAPDAPAAGQSALPMSSRFQLIGLASQSGERGAALIAVDGQPPRPVVVGDVVDGDLRLLSVGRRVARLGTGAGDTAALELSLPETPESP